MPFLDHRVIELALRLPLHLKVRDGVGKWCPRELLFQRVLKNLIERPKPDLPFPLVTGQPIA